MKVTAALCTDCRTLVYSRHRHDYRNCPCGAIAIDGGQDYIKLSFKVTPPIMFPIHIPQTKKQVFDDYNQRIDKLGYIKGS